MCIAIVSKPGIIIPENKLHNCWVTNPEGGGYAFVSDNSIKIRKGFMKWKLFYKSYKQDAQAAKTSPFLIHFRIRTHGSKDENNTHPFQIENGALIHNGCIHGTGANNVDGKSDTCLFAEKFSSKLEYNVIKNHVKEIEDALGTYNKIGLLYNDGNYLILNESSGMWDEEVWYSNRTYTQKKCTVINDEWDGYL